MEDARDVPYPFFRITVRQVLHEPYWLSIIRAENGLVQHRWDLNYTTREEAQAAAHSLLATGSVWSVYINFQEAWCGRNVNS